MNYKEIQKELESWIVSLKSRYRNYISANDEDKNEMYKKVKEAENKLNALLKAKINLVIDDMIGEIRDEAVLLIRDKREAIKVLKEYKKKFNK